MCGVDGMANKSARYCVAMCIDVLPMCFGVRPPPLDGAILSDIIEKDDVARD